MFQICRRRCFENENQRQENQKVAGENNGGIGKVSIENGIKN